MPLSENTMRPSEVKTAKAICDAHGEFNWKYLRDTEGNPSTAYAYFDYLRMGRAAVRVIEKLYAGGNVGKAIKAERVARNA